MSNNVMGYLPKDSLVHKIHPTAKLLYFIIVLTASMITYDTRLLVFIAVSSLAILKLSKIRYVEISFVIKFILFFSVLNLVMVYIFDPTHGNDLYQSYHEIFAGWGYFKFTYEEFFFLGNMVLKYICTVPLAISFLMTTNPSQFASSLNQIGVSYRISYAVALTLRYIPDIQTQYLAINKSQQARGLDLSAKAPFWQRVKAIVSQVMPFILNSFNNIDSINQAMELRRFGQHKRRTWISKKKMGTRDYLTLLLALFIFACVFLCWELNQGRFYNPFL
ncbi:energy-coupling factor transporter transmembrane component T family protein [Psittacicella gerlachiana]|uniref:Cobalt ABC transporter permease n=1 Tax=Psittacicella gerlachiana TaxID=2028574 RepID=A0A3A1YA21_9GAMM|nr:energy-coupling factor transporter transmembrane component T [Psittacicella gerlachiana]RIY34381.1 hypothetical protein CKF59_05525 [Psittacicella gerlachiana]